MPGGSWRTMVDDHVVAPVRDHVVVPLRAHDWRATLQDRRWVPSLGRRGGFGERRGTRLSALWYVPAVLVIVVSVASAMVILEQESRRIEDQVSSFARIEVPGDGIVTIPDAGEHVVYIEGRFPPREPIDPADLFILGVDDGARPLEVSEHQEFLTYSERAGFSGRAAYDVQVPSGGEYEVKLRHAPSDVTSVAVGERVFEGSLAPVRRSFEFALVGILFGVLGVAAVAWRRRRPRRRSAEPVGALAVLASEPEPVAGEEPVAERAQRLHRLAFQLLLVTFALLPLQNVRVLASVTFSDLALVAAAAVAAASGHPMGPSRPAPVAYVFGMVLLAAGALVGLVLAGTPVASLALAVRLGLIIVLTTFAVLRVAPSGAQVVRLLSAFTVVGGISGLLSAVGAATGLPLVGRFAFDGRAVGLTITDDSFLDVLRGGDAVASLADNPNLFGAISAVGAAIGLVLAVDAVGRRRVVLAAATAGLVLGVLYSGSRSALLALVVALVPAAWRVARTLPRRTLLGAGGALVLVVLLGLAFSVSLPSLDRLLLRGDSAQSEAAAESTLDRYQNSTGGIDARGWNSFVTGSGLRNEPLNALHNGHLEIWIGVGIVGFAGWVLLCAFAARPAVDLLAVRRALRRREVALFAVGCGFIANIVVMLFVDTVWNRYIWLLLALALTLHLRPAGAPTASTSTDAVLEHEPGAGGAADPGPEPEEQAPREVELLG